MNSRCSCTCLVLVVMVCCALAPPAAIGIIKHDPNASPSDIPPAAVVARWSSNASCVVIAPSWVVTTAHQGTKPGTIYIGGTWYNLTHDDINWEGGQSGSDDIRLAKVTTLAGDPANLTQYVLLYPYSDEPNKEVVFGGFGKDWDIELKTRNKLYGYRWDPNENNATLRWGTNRIERIGAIGAPSLEGYIFGDFDDPDVPDATPWEAIGAEYDSGSGWFIRVGGAWYVAGLTRGVEHAGLGESHFRSSTNPNFLDPDGLDAIRISYHLDWINSIIIPDIPDDPNAVIWVSPNGSDIAPGTYLQPVATIQEAVWRCNDVGTYPGKDTVYVLPGTYRGFINETPAGGESVTYVNVKSFDLSTESAGMNWANTIINADPNGQTDGTFVNVNSGGAVVNDPGYLLEGFTLLGPGSAGVGAANGIKGTMSTPVIRNCVITRFDVGISVYYNSIRAGNSLIYGNNIGFRAQDPRNGTPRELRNCTVTDNTVGIYAIHVPVDAYNSILWGNGDIDYRGEYLGDFGPETIEVHYSDLGSTESLLEQASITWDLTGSFNEQPLFQAGGYLLSASSPCTDAGSNALFPADPNDPNSLPAGLDLFGGARVQNSVIDVGTDEYGAADPNAPPLPPTPNDEPNYEYPDHAVSVSFSDDEKWVTIIYDETTWSLRRPVASQWNYTPSGSVYWADPNGNNSNPGTDPNRPILSIQRAVDLAGAGDAVYLKAGTYRQGFVANKTGTSGDPVIISCAPGALGDVVIAPPLQWWYNPNLQDPNDPNDDDDGWINGDIISISSGQHVWINGLVLAGSVQIAPPEMTSHYFGSGLQISGGAGNCRVTNCVSYDQIHCGFKGPGSGNTGGVLYEGNVALEIGQTSYDHGLYLSGPDCTVSGNFFINTTGGGIHAYNDTQRALLARNVCVGSEGVVGMALAGGDCGVYHNDLFDSAIGLEVSGSAGGNVIRNNLFGWNGQAIAFTGGADPNNYTVSHNHVYDPNSSDPNQSAPAADPRLVDPNGGDFRIYGLSPCVDAGADLSAEFAAAGLPYLYYDPNRAGTAPDIGAFEYIPGDNNGDGKCNIDDYITLIGHYNSAGSMADGDTNGDGQVNIDDYIDLVGNYDYALGAAAAAPGTGGEDVALEVSISVAGNVASASITGDTYGNTSYTYVWTASSATNTVYACGGPIVTFDIDQPGQYVVTVTVFGNVGGQATAVHRYLTM